MSNPENILSRFRSYSYHHVLIACDNEAAARFIRESNSREVFRELSIARSVVIAEEDKLVVVDETNETTGEIEKAQVGAYVVILNGMIDTAFVVRDAEWFTATASSTDTHDRFTSVAVEGKITIEEPRGIRFMNALNDACDLLQSDPTGVIWMLKTIFVGHGVNDDGSTFTDYITDLRPLEFMIYDVTGTFDTSGGIYEISFAGANNGAARFPQFSRVAQNIGFTPTDGNLQTSITELERQMNVLSETNRNCVIGALKEAYSDIDPAKLEEFRLVRYAIVLEEPYVDENYVIDGWTDWETDLVDGQAAFKFGAQSTVEQAIRHIMDRCGRVLKDRTEGDESGTSHIWKVYSEITMVGKGTRNPLSEDVSKEDIILVVYRIRQHAEITNQTVEQALAPKRGGDDEEQKVTPQAIKDNLLEFDYFFTGKNIDILDFDLKMEMGLAFLQTIASTNNIGTGTNQISGTRIENATIVTTTENDKQSSAEEAARPKILIRSKTPIFPATNTSNVFTRNIRGPDITAFNAALSKHAALESIEANVTIHGNPYLMSQTNRRGSDRTRRGNTSDESDVTKIMQNWDFMPGLVKVNIFMPRTNDTPSSRDVFDRDPFWYKGFYYLFGVDHKFNGGEFTQNLHLLSLPNQSLLDENQAADITECGIQEEQGGEEGNTDSTVAETVETVRSAPQANAATPPSSETETT